MLVLKYKDPSILLFLTPAYPTAVFSGRNIVALRSVILQKKKKKKRLLELLIFNQGIPIPVPYSNKAPS